VISRPGRSRLWSLTRQPAGQLRLTPRTEGLITGRKGGKGDKVDGGGESMVKCLGRG
jgi:hypothetical protein